MANRTDARKMKNGDDEEEEDLKTHLLMTDKKRNERKIQHSA
jgi:hypothetical protein